MRMQTTDSGRALSSIHSFIQLEILCTMPCTVKDYLFFIVHTFGWCPLLVCCCLLQKKICCAHFSLSLFASQQQGQPTGRVNHAIIGKGSLIRPSSNTHTHAHSIQPMIFTLSSRLYTYISRKKKQHDSASIKIRVFFTHFASRDMATCSLLILHQETTLNHIKSNENNKTVGSLLFFESGKTRARPPPFK